MRLMMLLRSSWYSYQNNFLARIRSESGTTYGWHMDVHPDYADRVDVFLEPHDCFGFGIALQVLRMRDQRGFWPWATVLMDQEYEIMDRIRAAREEPDDLLASMYRSPDEQGVAEGVDPKISILFFRSRRIAEALADKDVLLAECWDALSCLPEGGG